MQRTGNEVHVEDPRPGKVVDENAAERRPDRGTDDRSEREDRLARSQLFDREGVAQHDLRRREQAAAEGALHHAKQNQPDERGRHPAEHRCERKAGDRREEIVLAAEAQLQPRRHRNDDNVGDDVTGEHPRPLVDRRAEVALNRRQRDVDDGEIDGLQQRGEHDPDDDQVAARAVLDQRRARSLWALGALARDGRDRARGKKAPRCGDTFSNRHLGLWVLTRVRLAPSLPPMRYYD